MVETLYAASHAADGDAARRVSTDRSLRVATYRETAANNSECSSDWNFWSSVLKWT